MAESKIEILELWAFNLLKRILKEMGTQQISPNNPDYKGTGQLQRSIDFKIYNAAGGDVEKITFFYEYYALFVEIGVQKGQSYDQGKLSKPFYSGSKYAEKKPNRRPPKPFLSVLINQRTFALQQITDRVLTENITAVVMSNLSYKEKKERSQVAKNNFWNKYLKAKGRGY